MLTGNSTGISLFSANDNDIHHNIVHANTGTAGVPPGIGIAVVNSNGNQVKQNDVAGNGADGISVHNSSDNTLMNNQR